jgi:hypothetical protein
VCHNPCPDFADDDSEDATQASGPDTASPFPYTSLLSENVVVGATEHVYHLLQHLTVRH